MSKSKHKEVVSMKKAESNCRNAQRSTGPKTPKGKDTARWNALQHGLLAKELVIPAGAGMEDENEFRELLAGLRDDWQPDGVMQEILVEQIAVSYWRLRRVIRSENGRIRQNFESDGRWDKILHREPKSEQEQASQFARRALPQGDDADQILRYAAAIERALYRALAHLEKMKKEGVRSQKSGVRIEAVAAGERTETERVASKEHRAQTVHRPAAVAASRKGRGKIPFQRAGQDTVSASRQGPGTPGVSESPEDEVQAPQDSSRKAAG